MLECLERATAEVRGSAELRALLHLLRYAGNRLNMQGSLDCDARHSAETVKAVMGRYATALKLNEKLLQARALRNLEACIACCSLCGRSSQRCLC